MDNENFDNPNSSAQEESINLRHYWHVVLERRWLIITAFVSVFVLSLMYLFKATPIFEATTQIKINPEADNILRIEGFSVARQEQDYLQTQYKTLTSRSLLGTVVNQLKLEQDERYAQSIDRVSSLARDIQIAPIRLSRLVDVKVEHPDPERAAAIANSLATNFIQQNLDEKMHAAMDVVDRLGEEAETQKGKLEEVEKKLQAYSKSNEVVSFEGSENIILQALTQYTTEHARAQSAAVSARSAVQEVELFLNAGVSKFSVPQVANSPHIQELQKALGIAEAEFAELKKRYRHLHPEYIRAEEKVLSFSNSINARADILIAALRNSAQMAEAEVGKLQEQLEEQKAKQMWLKDLLVDYNILKREAEQNGILYQAILAKMKETDLTGRNKINNIVVVDAAEVPLNPVKPRKLLTIFLGMVGGLGVALGLAFFVNYLDDSIKSQDDVETYLRLPFLGYIPNIKAANVSERDLQAHMHPQSNGAEGFRTVRATISLTHNSEKLRMLAVTSTIPSEGKSLVASNLAIVTAQTGLKTILVDGDLRRPSVHKAFQLHSPVGLSSFLMAEEEDLSKIVHKSVVPNLDVVCCGSVPSTPSELIGSKRMSDFLQLLKERYDRIIVDCPPISAVSDPLIIAAMTDGVVFVTKFNKIRREHARKSVQRVQNAGIHIIGNVLNDIDFEGKDSYYYSYYYYQNRYYSSHYRTGGGDPGKREGSNQSKVESN
ncbi:MAG: polysaccharide biosynthesis tyrosine autokinase [Verrucomicrobia bacterium]|nr:polysaccharide biosynthesis tyrosine autokinase [Verrucomicrobiota bacterium]